MVWFGVVRGHPRSLKTAPFDRAHTTSYSSLIETIRLSCTVYEIAFDVQNRSILIPLLRLTLPTEGFPWNYLRKILRGGQRMAMPKGSTP